MSYPLKSETHIYQSTGQDGHDIGSWGYVVTTELSNGAFTRGSAGGYATRAEATKQAAKWARYNG